MSQENVEIVRAAFDALNRGDVDAALKEAAPDFEYDFSRSVGTAPGVYRLNEIKQFWEEFAGAWESSRWEAEDFIEAGEQVVTPIMNYHRGRQGIEVQARGRESGAVRLALDLSRWRVGKAGHLQRLGRCPRSRRAAGVAVPTAAHRWVSRTFARAS
jgi:ketosteroid isomerase-like protein